VILVRVRCGVPGCRTLLDEIPDAPPDEKGWSYYKYLHICPRHGGGHGSVAKWVESQKRLGRPYDEVNVGRYVQWSKLRPGVEKAWRTGKTAEMAARFNGKMIILTLK
jgi:hypothetical protein